MIPLWILAAVLTVILLFAAVIVLASSRENNKLVIEKYEIQSSKIPEAFDGFRIVFLTDLHCHEFGEDNEKLIEMVKECRPQMILAGGDMLISREEKSTEVPLKLMKQLAEKYPVYYADGNHELRLMRNEEIFGVKYKEYIHELKEYGVWHMSNETVILEQEGQFIHLTAMDLEPEFYHKFRIPEMKQEDMELAVGRAVRGRFQILLAHNPNYFRTYARWGADLVLAGHFHGGMVRIPKADRGVISPQFQLFPKYDAGEFHAPDGGSTMIVSRGLGNHSIKIRLFNKPEISCITLRRRRE
nr:metallophosphoesterase [uncultured Anaerostipes sp.]